MRPIDMSHEKGFGTSVSSGAFAWERQGAAIPAPGAHGSGVPSRVWHGPFLIASGLLPASNAPKWATTSRKYLLVFSKTRVKYPSTLRKAGKPDPGSNLTPMRKDRDVALMLSLYLGTIGADRLYLGQVLLGVLKAVTLGAFGIWTIVDWFLIRGTCDRVNAGRSS